MKIKIIDHLRREEEGYFSPLFCDFDLDKHKDLLYQYETVHEAFTKKIVELAATVPLARVYRRGPDENDCYWIVIEEQPLHIIGNN